MSFPRLFALVLISAFALGAPLAAATRTFSLTAPTSVGNGQSFTVPVVASTDFGGGEQVGMFHLEYSTNNGSTWTGVAYDQNLGPSATRTASITAGGVGTTIIVRARIAYRNGSAGDVDYNGAAINWSGSWNSWSTPPTKYAYISVLNAQSVRFNAISAKNTGQTLNLVGSVWVPEANGSYSLSQPWYRSAWSDLNNAFGGDVNSYWNHFQNWGYPEGRACYSGSGNEGAAHAQSGLPVTFSIDSGPATLSGNTLTFTGAGLVVVRATQAGGTAPNGPAYAPASTTRSITVNNTLPTISAALSPFTITFGQTVNYTLTATDIDGNLASSGVLTDYTNAGGGNYRRPPGVDYSAIGWNGFTVDDPSLGTWTSLSFSNSSASGSTNVKTGTYRPNRATPAYLFTSYVVDAYGTFVGAWPYCIVNKATPNGSFASKTFNGARTLTAADLNAAFANPYSAAVAVPTGSITYSIVSATGSGAAPTSGTISVGNTLQPGTYTIRASYPGDTNYNTSAIDSTFTVNNLAAQAAVTLSPSSANIQVGQYVTFTATGGSGAIGYVWGGSTPGSGMSKMVSFKNAGTYNITVNNPSNGIYAASNTASATVTVSAPTTNPVFVTPAVSTIVKGSAVTFSASGGAGTINYTWGGSASGTGNSKTITFSNAGAYSVTVQNPANGSNPASNVAIARISVIEYTESADLAAVSATELGAAAGIPHSNAGLITTGSGYDLRSGRMSRKIRDFMVAGSIGTKPLIQSRVCYTRVDDYGVPQSVWIPNSYEYIVTTSSATGAVIIYPTGGVNVFSRPTNDGVTSFRSDSGGKDRVKVDATGKVSELWLEDGSSILFSNNKPSQMRDINGLSISLTYGANGLSSATDASGRSITYTYYIPNGAPLPRLRRATGSDGQWAEYSWDTNGRITAVAYNDGTSGSYTYTSNGLPDTFRDVRAEANMQAVKFTFGGSNLGQPGRIPYAVINEKNPDTNVVVSEREPAPDENWNFNSTSRIYAEIKVGGDRAIHFDRHRVKKIVNPDGGIVQFSYTAGWLTGITDPLNNFYKYDLEPSIGAITRMTFPDATFQDFTYSNSAHPYFVSSLTNERGYTTTCARNTNGTIQRVDYPDGSYETWPSYNSFNQPLTHRLRNGATEWFEYDSSGRKTKHWLPSFGSQQDYIGYSYYDAPHAWADRVKTERDPMGNITTYEYDLGFVLSQGQVVQGTTPCAGRGLATKIINPDSTFTTFGYDIYGNKVWEENELRRRTTFTYDSYNRQTTVKDAENRQTTYAYNITDGVTTWDATAHTSKSIRSITSPDARITAYTHGVNLFVSSETRGMGASIDSKTTSEYNLNGLVSKMRVQVDAATWRETTYAYDSRNRKRFEYAPLGRTTEWQYDAAGNEVKVINPDATFHTTIYDVLNRPTTMIDEMGYQVDYTYTPSGKVDLIIDRKGYVYAHDYDAADRKTRLWYPNGNGTPLGASERWLFNAAGKVTDFYNRSGQHLVYSYDNRLRETNHTWDNNAAPAVSTTYFDDSLVKTRSNVTGTLTYTYDLAGLPISEAQAVTGAATVTTTFGYSGDGLRTSLAITGEISQGFAYNNLGLLQKISYNGNSDWTTYDYYMTGERKTRISPNGTRADYNYDGAGRLTLLNNYKVAGPVNILRMDFGYDLRDRRTYTLRDSTLGDVYKYQADSQLTEFRFGVSRPDLYPNGAPAILDTYGYDQNGNRTTRSEGGAVTNYTPNALNEYSAVSGSTISHGDGRGNITQWNGWTYSYDADNRLVSASGNGHTFAFAYDAQGRLAKLTDNAVAEFRYYDGAQLLLRKQANGTLIERIFWGLTPDEVVARWISTYGWHYFHLDPLNSPVAVTDGTGAVLERYLYDAYGAATIYDAGWNARSASAISNQWQFTGQEFLSGLGLHNYKNRFYSDDLGRFVQQDPLRFDAGDLNLYRYCQNSPLNFTDPLGLVKEGDGIPFIGTVTAGDIQKLTDGFAKGLIEETAGELSGDDAINLAEELVAETGLKEASDLGKLDGKLAKETEPSTKDKVRNEMKAKVKAIGDRVKQKADKKKNEATQEKIKKFEDAKKRAEDKKEDAKKEKEQNEKEKARPESDPTKNS